MFHEQRDGDNQGDDALTAHERGPGRKNRNAAAAKELRRRPPYLFNARAAGVRPPEGQMVYILAALLPPIGLLVNGQPFSAIFNVVLIVVCFLFGLIFPVLFLVPSAHAILAVYMKREDRKHREIVDAIERHGPPPGYRP
jgi:hypothetical protein